MRIVCCENGLKYQTLDRGEVKGSIQIIREDIRNKVYRRLTQLRESIKVNETRCEEKRSVEVKNFSVPLKCARRINGSKNRVWPMFATDVVPVSPPLHIGTWQRSRKLMRFAGDVYMQRRDPVSKHSFKGISYPNRWSLWIKTT